MSLSLSDDKTNENTPISTPSYVVYTDNNNNISQDDNTIQASESERNDKTSMNLSPIGKLRDFDFIKLDDKAQSLSLFRPYMRSFRRLNVYYKIQFLGHLI